MDRRQALISAAALMALPAVAREDKAPRKRKTIALLAYPEFTALDLVGPHHVFSVLDDYDVQIVSKTMDFVMSDTGLVIKPTMTLKDCPEELAVLFVPGGTTGTLKVMADAKITSFLRSRAMKADYVTSVCTGSLILGAAGLLRGYQATSHWATRHILKELGAEPKTDRVVWDRNRVTGGGVTAGIDFALTLAAKLKDETYAKSVQLMMEYSPSPPFKSGTPEEAGPEISQHMKDMLAPFVKSATTAAEKAKSNW
ncbi:MAG: DJ-1/PfpI family protein [Fimbriiglobus sp.]